MTQNETLIYSESLDEDPDEGPGNGIKHRVPLTKEERKECRRMTKERRKEKWGRKLLKLLLKGDKKNKSIKHQVVAQKQVLVDNLVGNTVQSKDINTLFWTYATIDQDIFVPSHVKYFASKKEAQVRINDLHMKMPWDSYLTILAYVRSCLSDFIRSVVSSKAKVHKQITKKLSLSDDISSLPTPYDSEEYYDEFKKKFFPLYENIYPQNSLSHPPQDFYSEGKIDLSRVVDFLAKISHYPQRESLFTDAFASIDMSQIINIENIQISLGDFIAIVRSLHISLHLLSPDHVR